MGGRNALDFIASGAAVRDGEPWDRRRGDAVAEQSAGAALDDAVSTPDVGLLHHRSRTRLRLLLELQMVLFGAGCISISGGDCTREFDRRAFWRYPALLLSLHPMVVQHADLHAGNDRCLLFFPVVTRAHSKGQITLGGRWRRARADRVNRAIRILRVSKVSNSVDSSRAFFDRWVFDP